MLSSGIYPRWLSLTRNCLSVQSRIAYWSFTGGNTYSKYISKFVAAAETRRTVCNFTNCTWNQRGSKRHRAAALQDLAECERCNPSRQPYAAFGLFQSCHSRLEFQYSSPGRLPKALVKIHYSRVLLNFTESREVSFGGKRMLLAATFPDSTQSIR
jgi:hypothetical protein